MNLNICPDCKVTVERNYGLPGVVVQCPKCRQDWVKCLDRLVKKEEFPKIKEVWA